MPSSADRLHPYVTGLATSCCSGSLKCQFQSCPIAAVLNTSKASSPRPFTISSHRCCFSAHKLRHPLPRTPTRQSYMPMKHTKMLATKNSVNLGAKGLNATGL
ncbi:uncharacterized protein LOC119167626 isoform X1 [Rhipicephalus microplus]|uniref:uncharacterized protein LOC119167626 isoform X1 n=1 Tax=Rhipicephalus microplus TaxID=6941 RepID=UPI003F6C6444